jgi:hypothetical protein
MQVLAFGLVVTAVLYVKLGFGQRFGAPNLGSMSPEWIAAFRASHQASSI